MSEKKHHRGKVYHDFVKYIPLYTIGGEIIYSEASKNDITYIIKVLGDNYRTKTTTME